MRIEQEEAAAAIATKKQKTADKKAKKAKEEAAKKITDEKAAKATKRAEAKAAKAAKKKAEEEAEQSKNDVEVVDETPAETDKEKPAVFEIGQVVQGCWEVDEEADAWEFGTVKSILWDEDPPKLGDPQWAYMIKWDDNTKDQLPWHCNGEEWPMHSLRVPSAKKLRKRKRKKPIAITSDVNPANICTRY